jgi:hypothetical protein
MTVPTDARAEMAAAIDYFEGRRMYRATRAMQRSLDALNELIGAVEERRRMSAGGRQSTGPFAVSDARIDVALSVVQGRVTPLLAPDEPDKPKHVRVPGLFWHDHADRAPYDEGQVGPRPLQVHRLYALFEADDPGLPLLLADARYYADAGNMDECPRNLRESARRTAAALEAAGVLPPGRNPEPNPARCNATADMFDGARGHHPENRPQ